MRTFAVEDPAPVPPAPATLGRLGLVLERLAAQQGAWPPRRPARVQVAAPPATARTAAEALEAGAGLADRLVDEGADLLVLRGGGADVPALVVLAALLGRDPVSVVGTTPSPGWSARVTAVRDGLRAARAHLGDPVALLGAAGALDVAGLAGLLLQAGARRTGVLLSGAPDVWAAAVAGQRVAPELGGWLLAGVAPHTEVVSLAVGELLLRPLLDLGLDDPRGADLALGVLLDGVGLAGA